MSKKFELEKSITDAFLKSKGLTQYELIKPESDPPDIIVKIDDRFIGVEVTSIVSNVPQRILENEYSIIFTRVKETLIKSGVEYLEIRIEPEKNQKLNRDQCVEVIVNVCLQQLDNLRLKRTELAINPTPGIKKIVAFKTTQQELFIGFDSRSHGFGPLYDFRVKPVIENKISKLKKSRQANPQSYSILNEIWLLMTVEGTFYANYTGVSKNQISIMSENCYDQIFVFHQGKNWCADIKAKYNAV